MEENKNQGTMDDNCCAQEPRRGGISKLGPSTHEPTLPIESLVELIIYRMRGVMNISRANEIAITKLEEALFWLGKI